jgi:putative peptide zinc metalloprotease protein
MNEQIFSNSWYIVSELKVSLLSTVTIQKQYYRGKNWYILKDSFNNKFFRIKPEAYHFIAKLNTKSSIEEIWEGYLEKYPLVTPTQDELVKLLSQLHLNNLLFFENRVQSTLVFERYNEQKKKMLRSKIMSFLFIKVPIFNPNRFLDMIHPLTKIILSTFGFLIWIVTLLYALKIAIDNSSALGLQAQGMLSPNNLVYLFITLFILKTIHEFGHAMMCKKFGGPVHTLGLMFLVFTPLPYMDASSSWGFRNNWHRVLVGSAGMLIELFIAALASIIWVNTGDGFIHALSFNVMVIASVSSFIFNANPLLKLDAYYMLSDMLEIPNLSKRANQQFLYFFKKNFLRLNHVSSPSHCLKEIFWLNSYAVFSYLYRLLVSLTIMLFVADQIFIVGVIVGVMSLYLWIFKPLYTLFTYLSTSNELNRNRYSAVLLSVFSLLGILLVFIFLPVSNSIRASGVLYANGFSKVYTPNEGYLVEVYIKNGHYVKQGDLIAKLISPEMKIEQKSLIVELEKTEALSLKAQQDISDLKPLKKRIQLIKDKLKKIEDKEKKLIINAESSGIWISSKHQTFKKSFITQGTYLGDIIPQNGFRFIAVVSQEKSYDLFEREHSDSTLKLMGLENTILNVSNLQLIPYKQNILPSAVLGWLGGGDIKVSQEDKSGRKSVEAFFEIRADVNISHQLTLNLYHHHSGVLRIALEKSSLFEQFSRYIKQLMQRKYQI